MLSEYKVGGRGGIGRHDGLKIRCLVIVREGSSPSVPNQIKSFSQKMFEKK